MGPARALPAVGARRGDVGATAHSQPAARTLAARLLGPRADDEEKMQKQKKRKEEDEEAAVVSEEAAVVPEAALGLPKRQMWRSFGPAPVQTVSDRRQTWTGDAC